MRFPIRFFPDSSHINFVRWRWLGLGFSLLVMLGSLGLFFTKGLSLGIDFTGGVVIELRSEKDVPLAELRKAMADPRFGEVTLQTFGATNEIMVRLQGNTEQDQAAIVAAAKEVIEAQSLGEIEYRKVDFVGPTVGKELAESAYWAFAVVIFAILAYVWFRFEWQFGVGTVAALLHDGIAIIGFYSLTGIDFGLPAVAAILTVLGYSVNDSVVIYDRVRENLRKFKKMPLGELINVSVNDTLSRTVLTAGTTLISALALILFGGEVILGFSQALFFGVVVGTYSSIFISAPLLLFLKPRSN